MDAALQPLCNQSMRVFFYLDNLIVMARSREWAIFNTAKLVPAGRVSGSCVQLSQSAGRSVGIQIDGPAAGSPPAAAGSSGDSFVHHAGVGAHGNGSSSVSLGLLHMHRLQRFFASLRLDPKRHKHRMVNIPPSVQKVFTVAPLTG